RTDRSPLQNQYVAIEKVRPTLGSSIRRTGRCTRQPQRQRPMDRILVNSFRQKNLSPPGSLVTPRPTIASFVLEDPPSFLLYSRVPPCHGFRIPSGVPVAGARTSFQRQGSDRVWWTAISFVNSVLTTTSSRRRSPR